QGDGEQARYCGARLFLAAHQRHGSDAPDSDALTQDRSPYLHHARQRGADPGVAEGWSTRLFAEVRRIAAPVNGDRVPRRAQAFLYGQGLRTAARYLSG